MQNFGNRVRPDWKAFLGGLLDSGNGTAVFAFDLDSTLFDNRPRQARIVREFGEARKITSLTRCTKDHWTAGWDMKAAMINCGLSAAETEALYADARRFWTDRFFTSPYCLDDEPIPGAAEFVGKALKTGAIIAYVTGRHEAMREGSIGAMKKHGLPVPGENDRVHLIMKPSLKVTDDDFKREAHAKLKTLGSLVAAFDNEPTHVNDYFRQFPSAKIVHLATDHSGRPVELLEGIVSVPHFGL